MFPIVFYASVKMITIVFLLLSVRMLITLLID